MEDSSCHKCTRDFGVLNDQGTVLSAHGVGSGVLFKIS